MRRNSYKKYIFFAVFLVLLFSLSISFTGKMRAKTIALFSPLWKKAAKVRSTPTKIQLVQNECKRLESENHLLKIEIGKLKALIEQQMLYEGYQKENARYLSKGSVRRFEESSFLSKFLSYALPAQVIYRDPANWTSSLWINVGEETNLSIGKKIIQKNSPVVLGRAILGAIDYVGTKQSRVRLITDLGLKPSVRAVRGYPQNVFLVEHIEALLRSLHLRSDLPISSEEIALMSNNLELLKNSILEKEEGLYLAKGIVQGKGNPLWRSRNNKLKGIGFNYDFSDEEGPSRDLLTGKPIGSSNAPIAPLLKINDLLITTGMDGVFPAGLRVGEITKVFPLREGGYTYEIEATPLVNNSDEIYTLFVIPPLGFDFNDQPS